MRYVCLLPLYNYNIEKKYATEDNDYLIMYVCLIEFQRVIKIMILY